MFNFSVLGSGSSGNCAVVQTHEGAILIDAGLTRRRIYSALESLEISLNELKAIIITHEHIDHVKSAGMIAKALGIQMYMTSDTANVCIEKLSVADKYYCTFAPGDDIDIIDLHINTLSTSHDAVDPVCFRISQDKNPDVSLGYLTDTGYITQDMHTFFTGCTSMVIESNYDREMLLDGPYHEDLKLRIIGDKGHLSNSSAMIITYSIKPKNNLVYAHVSEDNNDHELIMSEFYSLNAMDIAIPIIAKRNNPTQLLEV